MSKAIVVEEGVLAGKIGSEGTLFGSIVSEGALSGSLSMPIGYAGFDQLRSEIGELSALQTNAKENLVAAINEVAQSGGGGSISVEDDGVGNVEITEVPSGWTVTDDGNGNVVIGG